MSQGPVYTKRQHQRYDDDAMMLAILFSLKTMESLENGLQTQSGETPVFSMRTDSQASSLCCRSVDAFAWYKRAVKGDVILPAQRIQNTTHRSEKSSSSFLS